MTSRNLILVLAAMGSLCFAAPSIAQEHPTYESLWNDVTHDPNCKLEEYSDLFLFTCRSSLTFWYFTKPSHPAHPGVIKRSLVQKADGSFSVQEDGTSFGPDSAQPAFQAWLAQIVELDRRAKEEFEKKGTAQSPVSKQ